MNNRLDFVIERKNERRMEVVDGAIKAIRAWVAVADLHINLSDVRRSLDANAAMWPALHDIAAQVGYRPARWRGDRCVQEGGYAPIGPGIRALTPEDWKDVLTALWKTTSGVRIRYVPHPDGNGLIALGLRTSKLSKRAMSDFLDCVYAFGAMHGVRFTAPDRWAA